MPILIPSQRISQSAIYITNSIQKKDPLLAANYKSVSPDSCKEPGDALFVNYLVRKYSAG